MSRWHSQRVGADFDRTGSEPIRHHRTVTGGADDPRMNVTPLWVSEAVDRAEAHALHRARVDWTRLRAATITGAPNRIAAGRAETVLAPVFRALADEHSFILRPDEPARASGDEPQPLPEAQILGGGVRYLNLPGVWAPDLASGDDLAYVRVGLECVDQLDSTGPLIVDLRENGGGNCHPMLVVLAPFLEPGRLVGWDRGDHVKWVVYDGAAVISESNARHPTAPPVRNRPTRTAVLTGPSAGSSGEAALLALRDRPATRTFGQPTAGMTTANEAFPLSGGFTLCLAVAQMVSSAGIPYSGPVAPHEVCEVDDALARSVDWVRNG